MITSVYDQKKDPKYSIIFFPFKHEKTSMIGDVFLVSGTFEERHSVNLYKQMAAISTEQSSFIFILWFLTVIYVLESSLLLVADVFMTILF